MSSRLSPSLDHLLPPLDMHAHIDPTVTRRQLATLGNALVFAVTRSLVEAERVRGRSDPGLIWGVGTHPGIAEALTAFDPDRFRCMIEAFAFVGEVGLDRNGPQDRALHVLHEVLAATRRAGRLCSIHSTGCQGAVIEAIHGDGAGLILHWFTGSKRQIESAAEAGVYFSVNAAMKDHQIEALPPDRLLPETDFPFSKRAGSARPGDIDVLERRVATMLGQSRDEVRQMWYRNLRTLAMSSGVLGSLPEAIARPLLAS